MPTHPWTRLQKVNNQSHKKLSILFFLIFVTAFCIQPLPGSAQESSLLVADINVDNQPIQTQYVLRDGHLFVPALFFKHTGTKVDWNEEYQSVVFKLNHVSVAARTGKSYIDISEGNINKWDRAELAGTPITVDEQTFVPLLEIGQKLGLEVSYDANLKRTSINNPHPRTYRRTRTGDPAVKQIALTFDDGPDSIYTSQVLDILADKGVPGTFFVVGQQVHEFPDEMKRIVEDGHGIANHTFTHPRFSKITSNSVLDELRSTQLAMEKTVGLKPDLFRPPYGEITRADEEQLYEQGFRTIMWSVDTLDWTGLTGDEIFSIVEREISPGGIILQHTIDWNPGILDGTVEALPKIIDELQAQGYTFVTVQTLLD